MSPESAEAIRSHYASRAIGRGARFFLVAGLIRAGGERFEAGLRQHVERLGWAMVVIVGVLILWLTQRG